MRKYLLILGCITLFSFTTHTVEIENRSALVTTSIEVQSEIAFMNEIIQKKLDKSHSLKKEAALLLEIEPTSSRAADLLKESELQLLMTLKYRAAIACRQQ